MASFVAFLKGMNLGRRRIRNDELCAAFEAIGMTDVWAFLASGNVVFTSRVRSRPKLAARIAADLEAQLQYPVPTFLRSADEVRAIATHQAFDAETLATTAGKVQVAMLTKQPTASKKREAIALAGDDDAIAFHNTELYWLPRGGVSESDLDFKALARGVGVMTIRTRRTFERLAKKLPA